MIITSENNNKIWKARSWSHFENIDLEGLPDLNLFAVDLRNPTEVALKDLGTQNSAWLIAESRARSNQRGWLTSLAPCSVPGPGSGSRRNMWVRKFSA